MMELQLPLLLDQPVLTPVQKALLAHQQVPLPLSEIPSASVWVPRLRSVPAPRRSLLRRVLQRLLPRAA
jgi:hypothetical protein